VRRTVETYQNAGLRPLLVTVGYQSDHVRTALDGMDLTFVDNPEYEAGQSRALVHAVRALPPSVDAAIIGVADQPYLTPATLCALVLRWRETGAPAVYPVYGGHRGSPTLFARSLFPELLAVVGDEGGRGVLRRHRAEAIAVDIPDAREAMDIDTPDDLAGLR
jgi:molybdenum cofactor cytidylyltransferase